MVTSSDPNSVPVTVSKRRRCALTKPYQLTEAFILLFLNTPSIQGLNRISVKKRHPIEAFFWIIAMSAAVFGCAKVSLTILDRYQSNPVVISIERNFLEWNTTFPTIVVCPKMAFSEDAIKEVVERYPNIKDRSAFTKFFKELVSGSYLDWKDKLKTPFREVDPKDFWKIVYDIRWDFTYKVSNSKLQDQTVYNMSTFMTEVGICYSYNSLASPYSEREYWESNNWTFVSDDLPLFYDNPLDSIEGYMFAQVMFMNTGYKLFLLDSYEVPDVAVTHYEASEKTYKTFDTKCLSIRSDPKIEHQLTVSQRKCRFPRESNLLTGPAYSYNRCRQECRMKLSRELCGCVAYFYRPTKGFSFCDYDGYLCLGKHGSLIHFLSEEDGKHIECDCAPLCSETKFVTKLESAMSWNLGTNLKITLTFPRVRYTRGISFRITDLIVKIGGITTFFLGWSLLRIAEIFYFLTVGISLYLYSNFHR